MCIVSKKGLNSAELETMRTSRSPTTVMTANGEVQTREEATEYVKQLDLFVKVMLLEETLAVLSGNSVRIMGVPTTGQPVKKSHPKLTRELIAIFHTVYHSWFLVYQRVLPHLHLHLPLHHLHHRSQYRLTQKTEILKIQYQKKYRYEWRASEKPAAKIHRNNW